MIRHLIFILLMINLFSCGVEESEPISLSMGIKMNGFLDSFRGGNIRVNVYSDKKTDNSTLTCTDLKDGITEGLPSNDLGNGLALEIPKEGALNIEKLGVSIKTGKKLAYAELFNEAGEKKGHACEKIVECSYLGQASPPDGAYQIDEGERGCVLLSIELF
ncbi:hypothetical protein JXR93_11760 [bacterium]|nr:hypothetical protein [bacterium]